MQLFKKIVLVLVSNLNFVLMLLACLIFSIEGFNFNYYLGMSVTGIELVVIALILNKNNGH